MVGEYAAKLLTLAAAIFTAGAEGKFSTKKTVDVKLLISGFLQFIDEILPKSLYKCVCEIILRWTEKHIFKINSKKYGKSLVY